MKKHSADSCTSITAAIIDEMVARRYETLSEKSLEIARQCLMDWLGVTLAAADEPLVRILIEDCREQCGQPHASIVRGGRSTIYDAALINGASGHALDYDDVAFAMSAHASAAILPGLTALAQFRKASGRAILAAFVAGYEAGCRIGTLVAPGHYQSGFHGTGTIGTFAAAASCSHLLGLDSERATHAIGIAATQAAGIRSMFGTMCKPLHAGKAAQNGLRAAVLAEKGFETRPDALECSLGFAATHSPDFRPEQALAPPQDGYFLYRNLFKFHASCYLTHSAIENVAKLHAEAGFDPNRVRAMTITANPGVDTVCNIASPRSGLEAKFSLRQCIALALAGEDTSRLETFSDRMTADPRTAAIREKMTIDFNAGQPETFTKIAAFSDNGKSFEVGHDSDVPAADLEQQRMKLQTKFRGLCVPRIGADATGQMLELIATFDDQQSIDPLLEGCFDTRD